MTGIRCRSLVIGRTAYCEGPSCRRAARLENSSCLLAHAGGARRFTGLSARRWPNQARADSAALVRQNLRQVPRANPKGKHSLDGDGLKPITRHLQLCTPAIRSRGTLVCQSTQRGAVNMSLTMHQGNVELIIAVRRHGGALVFLIATFIHCTAYVQGRGVLISSRSSVGDPCTCGSNEAQEGNSTHLCGWNT